MDEGEGDRAADRKPSERSLSTSPLQRVRLLLDWVFRNRGTGRITVAQRPNVPLWLFLLTVVLRWVVSHGSAVRTPLDWIAFGALAWWALDEVVRGVNPWRRFLGIAGCVFAAVGLASLLH